MTAGATQLVDIKHFHLFCGLGGGAKGFNRGQARVGNLEARFRCIGGIDVDAASIRDFSRASKVAGTVRDLFNRDQYVAFHGHEPPADWREASLDDIRTAAHGEFPDIIFLSAPCKGFSGLLPEASSKTDKYQALNALTLRGVWLALEAFKDNPPALFVFENVPRIAIRGRHLLDQIGALFRSYGYVLNETTHDCGELGGLGQSRKRFLLVARHPVKVPPFLYQPEKKRLRGVGEILEKLPLPGVELGGPMHRMPALQWKTWVRLAFVEAGSDWRSLNKLNVDAGVLTDFGIVPDVDWHKGVLGVRRWTDTTGVVAGESSPTNGAFSVADPRGFAKEGQDWHGLKVNEWQDTAGAVTTQRSPGSSAQSVADPRIDGHEKSVQHGVGRWEQPAAVVKGDVSVGTGRYAVADPRHHGRPLFNNVFRIVPWGEAAPAVAGPGSAAGGISVADPRPQWNANAHGSKLAVQEWDGAARTIGGARFGSGGGAVADPRPPAREDYKTTKYRVTGMDEPAGSVIAASTTGNGAFAVADPRSGLDPDRKNYQTGGHYGVQRWDQTSRAVMGFAKYDRAPFSVADPREPATWPNSQTEPTACQLPAPDERLVCVIRALDTTWHRPFTTLELAALQSLVDPDELFTLDGQSDTAWRERIGNAVPPDAAAAVASEMGEAILLAMSGETFTLSSKAIWVRPIALALAVDHSPNEGLLD